MDPSDKAPSEVPYTVEQAIKDSSTELATYSAEYFAAPDVQRVTKGVLAALADTSETAPITQLDAWEKYETVHLELAGQAFALRGDEGLERLEIAAGIHKATVYQIAGNSIRYFGEMQNASEYAYQAESDEAHEISDQIQDVLAWFLDENDIYQEDVIPLLLNGSASQERERIANGQVSLWDEGDPHEDMSDLELAVQLALEEELQNGADLQDILGDLYREAQERMEDPIPVFTKLGFTNSTGENA